MAVEVFYDGSCGLCRRLARWMRRLDWFGSLQITDFAALPIDEQPVEYAVFDRGIPVRTSDGLILIGFDGLRHAFLRTPIGWIAGWVFYLPGISHLSRRLYRFIARRRHGGNVACTLPRQAGSEGDFASDAQESTDAKESSDRAPARSAPHAND